MKLLVLDGNSIINRAFYGVRPLTNREGLNTNAIYGFLNILEKLMKEENPAAVCVAFDLQKPTFRHFQYEGYKANRKGMPPELAEQLPFVKRILCAMNIPIYECEGWEADDVIGTICRICGLREWDCVVATGDRDSLQLIDDHVCVKIASTKAGEATSKIYDRESFTEEYGLAPKQMVDLKALMGDSSDNIPGVYGIGMKTAIGLLQKFGTLKGVYDNIDDPFIRPKARENLIEDRDLAFLSYVLATIRCDVPIEFSPEDAKTKEYDKVELYKIFSRLEFVKLIDKYHLRDVQVDIPETLPEYRQLPLVDKLPPSGTECAMYLTDDDELGVAWSEGVCVMTPMEVRLDYSFRPGGTIGSDIKMMYHRMRRLNPTYTNFTFDTALAAYMLNPSQADHSVSKLATNFLGINVNEADPRACAEAMWYLRDVMTKELKAKGMYKLYQETEIPLCRVLFEMERAGITLDYDMLERFGEDLQAKIDKCEEEIFSYADGPFNINSTKQLGQLLFDKLGLPVVKKTKSGYSTNADVLEKLKAKHPIIPAIMDYRMYTKLKSTYVDGMRTEIQSDFRIRSCFKNMVTATGRLSSTEPNLQNIPVRTEVGSEIRKMFMAKEGFLLVDADYSQIELRVLAHIAGDKALQKAFAEGTDIHTATASQVFNVPVEEVTPLQRRHAKAVNFGIVYGMSDFSLAQDLGITRQMAKNYIDKYLDTYPGVRAYMKNVVEEARERGYTQTIYGRRRYIPELKSSNYNIRQGAERMALNTPIQGTAADLIKMAMVRVTKALKEKYDEAYLILQVHDELIVECREEYAEDVAAIVKTEMERVAQLDVALVADTKIGKTWYEAK